jgi:hypothetical protein
MMSPVFGVAGREALRDRCRWAEPLGYDTVFAVGGTGDRVLTIAAEHADIVAIAGLPVQGTVAGHLPDGHRRRHPTSGSGSPATALAPGPTGSNGTS